MVNIYISELYCYIFKYSLMIYLFTQNLKHQEKLSNIDLEDYLEPRESPVMPLSYYVLLSVIYFDISAGGCSFRCFRRSKYDSENSLQGIISTCSDISLPQSKAT